MGEAKRVSGDAASARSLLLQASELLGLRDYITSSSSLPSHTPNFSPDGSHVEDSLLDGMSKLTLSPQSPASPLSPDSLRSPSSSPQSLSLAILLLHSWAQQQLTEHINPLMAASLLNDAALMLKKLKTALSTTHNMGRDPPFLLCLIVQNAQLKAEAMLAQSEPSRAMEVCQGVLASFSPHSPSFSHPQLRLHCAQLHLTMGRAILMDIHQHRPLLATAIWEGVGGRGGGGCVVSKELESDEDDVIATPASRSRGRRRLNLSSDDEIPVTQTRGKTSRGRGRGRGKGRRGQLATKKDTVPRPGLKKTSCNHTCLSPSSFPTALHPALSHLLTSYQLCHPLRPSLLLRDVSQLLGVCLASWDVHLSAHFLLVSSQLTLTHHTILTLSRKIRKQITNHMSDTILSTLSRGVPVSGSQQLARFVRARSILLPPREHPPTLTHTTELMAAVPEQWTLCQLQLLEGVFPSQHQHLVMVRVRRGRDPLVVRIPLQTTVEVDPFSVS